MDEYQIFLKDVYDDDDGKINYFMENIIPDFNTQGSQPIMKRMIDDFHDMLFVELKKHSYSQFLNKTMNTIDVYGLGISLMYVLNQTTHLIPNDMARELNDLFMKMLHFNVFKRIDSLTAKKRYETIISRYQ